MRDLSFLAPGWRAQIGREFDEPYLDALRVFLRDEYRAGAQVYPPKDRIFAALSAVDFSQVRVVILGQDPYHGPHQAIGLSFAVPNGVPTPPSLKNIFKEVATDLATPEPRHTCLSGWAEQGVLLLNSVLTVRAGEAFSHRNRGWETLTNRIIEALGVRPEPLVFLLWGAPAQAKASLISNAAHCILKAPHPSPLSAHRGFLGCRHFSKANAFLTGVGQPAIDWSRTLSFTQSLTDVRLPTAPLRLHERGLLE
jgi:uracil-DNA glycosylase